MIYSKSVLKQQALDYRKSLSDEVYLRLSMMITYRLCYIYPFKEAQNYHFFIGSDAKKEIITKPLIEILLKAGRSVFVPKVDDLNTLKTHQIFSLNDLATGAYGIEEPQTPVIDRVDYDCLIIPMLAGDLKGNRIGYGKGYYDRFLSNVNGSKVGLVYDSCLVDEFESEKHDIPLDMIITENRIIDLK